MSAMRWKPLHLSLVLPLLPGLASAMATARGRASSPLRPPEQPATPRAAAPAALARGPRLYFLFMARAGLPNEEVWRRFLAPARPGADFQALVHCTDEESCRRSIQDPETFRVIPATASKWCEDLVSPMNALMAHAWAEGAREEGEAGHPHDKFIFVSDTTVPVKPWGFVQHALGEGDGSNSSFCVRPWWTWAWHDANVVAVKHDQWLILSREHVRKALSSRETPTLMHSRLVPLHWAKVEWLARGLFNINKMILQRITGSHAFGWTIPTPTANGCIDEYWHFASVFGYLDRELSRTGLAIPGLSGGNLVMDESTAKQTQGRCDTYVRFNHDDQFPELTEALQRAADTHWERARNFKHPGRFDQLSRESLGLLRSSSFLFARKVDADTTFAGNLSLSDAFDAHVFLS